MGRDGAKSGAGKGTRNARVYAPTHSAPRAREGVKPTELEAPITKRTPDRYELARARWREAPVKAPKEAPREAHREASRKAPKDALRESPKGARSKAPRQARKEAPKGARGRPDMDKQSTSKARPKKKGVKRGRQETVLVPIALLGLGQHAATTQTPKQEAQRKGPRPQERGGGRRSGTRGTLFSPKSMGRQDKPKREKRPPMSGKKALSIVAGMVVCIGLLLAGYFVFLLESVVVEGNELYSSAQIVELSGLVKDRHMLLINTDAVGRYIGENPYIEVLSVEKLLPRTIHIQVSERKEAAVIRNQGYDVIMDIKGHVLSIGSSGRLDGLLHIYGMSQQGFQVNKPIGANEDIQTDTLRTILAQLEALGLVGDVEELNLSNPLRVTMSTTDGVTVLLGQAGGMEEKLMWMRDTLPSLRASGITSGTLDVSAKGGPIYSPEGARQLGAGMGGAATSGAVDVAAEDGIDDEVEDSIDDEAEGGIDDEAENEDGQDVD